MNFSFAYVVRTRLLSGLVHFERTVRPVNSLRKCVLCRGIMRREIIGKAHDTVGRSTSASAGNGHLGQIAAFNVQTRACSDAVFSYGYGAYRGFIVMFMNHLKIQGHRP